MRRHDVIFGQNQSGTGKDPLAHCVERGSCAVMAMDRIFVGRWNNEDACGRYCDARRLRAGGVGPPV